MSHPCEWAICIGYGCTIHPYIHDNTIWIPPQWVSYDLQSNYERARQWLTRHVRTTAPSTPTDTTIITILTSSRTTRDRDLARPRPFFWTGTLPLMTCLSGCSIRSSLDIWFPLFSTWILGRAASGGGGGGCGRALGWRRPWRPPTRRGIRLGQPTFLLSLW